MCIPDMGRPLLPFINRTGNCITFWWDFREPESPCHIAHFQLLCVAMLKIASVQRGEIDWTIKVLSFTWPVQRWFINTFWIKCCIWQLSALPFNKYVPYSISRNTHWTQSTRYIVLYVLGFNCWIKCLNVLLDYIYSY